LIYHERENAFVEKELTEKLVRDGTEQQFFNREEAMFAREKSMNSKNMTATEFFKQDEAVRGNIDSRDKSFAATQ
jgi:hypothetical protein